MKRLLEAIGLPLGDAEPHDIDYVLRGKKFDASFRKEEALPVLNRTLKRLGLDLDRQVNIRIDTKERPTKLPGAFCVRLRVPEDIRLVVMPIGGYTDFANLFHEAGHAEHFGNARPTLPFEYRYLGDKSVTEGWAFLLQHITLAPGWLQREVGLQDVRPFLMFAYTSKLYWLRRYAAKLSYEIRLHTRGLDGMDAVYASELGRVLGFRVPQELYLSDLADGFYTAEYLRAWILDAQVRVTLRRQYGDAWWESREAGKFLRRQWSTGQTWPAEDLLANLGWAGLDLEPLLEEIEFYLSG